MTTPAPRLPRLTDFGLTPERYGEVDVQPRPAPPPPAPGQFNFVAFVLVNALLLGVSFILGGVVVAIAVELFTSPTPIVADRSDGNRWPMIIAVSILIAVPYYIKAYRDGSLTPRYPVKSQLPWPPPYSMITARHPEAADFNAALDEWITWQQSQLDSMSSQEVAIQVKVLLAMCWGLGAEVEAYTYGSAYRVRTTSSAFPAFTVFIAWNSIDLDLAVAQDLARPARSPYERRILLARESAEDLRHAVRRLGVELWDGERLLYEVRDAWLRRELSVHAPSS